MAPPPAPALQPAAAAVAPTPNQLEIQSNFTRQIKPSPTPSSQPEMPAGHRAVSNESDEQRANHSGVPGRGMRGGERLQVVRDRRADGWAGEGEGRARERRTGQL